MASTQSHMQIITDKSDVGFSPKPWQNYAAVDNGTDTAIVVQFSVDLNSTSALYSCDGDEDGTLHAGDSAVCTIKAHAIGRINTQDGGKPASGTYEIANP